MAPPVYFSNSAPCSYPYNSVAPRTQLTPAPCCLVPSGAANTCPGYISLHPCAAVGASLYPNGDPCSPEVALEQVGQTREAGRIFSSFFPVSVLEAGEWEVYRIWRVPPPNISPLLHTLSLALASNVYHLYSFITVTFTQLLGLTAVTSSSKIQLLFPLAIPATHWCHSRHHALQCPWLTMIGAYTCSVLLSRQQDHSIFAAILLPFN